MTFTTPIPFSEAIQKLLERGIVPSDLESSEWRQVEVALREKAFFSSRVESARVLQGMKDYLGDYLAGTRMENGGLKAQGRAQFVADMRELAIREGLGRIDLATGKVDPVIRESDLTDIRSTRRLQLIFDTQVEAAHEYGFWKQGQDPAILYVFPAYRFLRIRPVMIPRFYHQAEEGTIRRKDDLKFWLSMNRDFNVPWGPWGYGSGMGVEDVNREDAIAAGVMSEADVVLPIEKTFNDGLSASVRDLDGGITAALARICGGTLADGRIVAAQTTFQETILPHPSGQGTLEMAHEIYEELRAALSRPERGGEFLAGVFPAPIQAKLAEFAAVEAAEVAGAAVEESVLVTDAGELFRRTGNRGEVDWDGVDLSGALMTHTHPGGGTLGPADIVLAMGRAMEGVRAHAGERIYSAKPGLKAKVFTDKSELMADPDYNQAFTDAWAVVNQMSPDYQLATLDLRKEAATHLTWIGLERKGWIVYHVEKP